MSVDAETVRRVAHLARVAVAEDEIEHLAGELNAMLAFVEQLSEVDVAGVEPMTSVTPMAMKMRKDEVTDGGIADGDPGECAGASGSFFSRAQSGGMMCIACEQDAMWFAYLRRKGLITPDGFLVEEPPSLMDPIEQPAAEDEKQNEKKAEPASRPAEQSKFSSDDPAG